MMSQQSANALRLLVLAGDGIGPEITAATLGVLREVDRIMALGLSFTDAPVGFAALKAHGTTLPEATLRQAGTADGVILGPVSHNDYPPVAEGGINPSGELRRRLEPDRPLETEDDIEDVAVRLTR
jgi:isocitrate/isopropylmalate dehydrogenase